MDIWRNWVKFQIKCSWNIFFNTICTYCSKRRPGSHRTQNKRSDESCILSTVRKTTQCRYLTSQHHLIWIQLILPQSLHYCTEALAQHREICYLWQFGQGYTELGVISLLVPSHSESTYDLVQGSHRYWVTWRKSLRDQPSALKSSRI